MTYTAMYVLEATDMLCISTVKSNTYHETQEIKNIFVTEFAKRGLIHAIINI